MEKKKEIFKFSPCYFAALLMMSSLSMCGTSGFPNMAAGHRDTLFEF